MKNNIFLDPFQFITYNYFRTIWHNTCSVYSAITEFTSGVDTLM